MYWLIVIKFLISFRLEEVEGSPLTLYFKVFMIKLTEFQKLEKDFRTDLEALLRKYPIDAFVCVSLLNKEPVFTAGGNRSLVIDLISDANIWVQKDFIGS